MQIFFGKKKLVTQIILTSFLFLVMKILGNYKNNYDVATKTAQWVLTPKQLNLVFCFFEALPNGLNKPREAITKILVFRFGSS